MKDYNTKGTHGSGHLKGMESKHGRKLDGSFYHNVGSRNLMKGGHSSEHAEMKMASAKGKV